MRTQLLSAEAQEWEEEIVTDRAWEKLRAREKEAATSMEVSMAFLFWPNDPKALYPAWLIQITLFWKSCPLLLWISADCSTLEGNHCTSRVPIVLDCLEKQCQKERGWCRTLLAGDDPFWKHKCQPKGTEGTSCSGSALTDSLKCWLWDQKRSSLCPFTCFFPPLYPPPCLPAVSGL